MLGNGGVLITHPYPSMVSFLSATKRNTQRRIEMNIDNLIDD